MWTSEKISHTMGQTLHPLAVLRRNTVPVETISYLPLYPTHLNTGTISWNIHLFSIKHHLANNFSHSSLQRVQLHVINKQVRLTPNSHQKSWKQKSCIITGSSNQITLWASCHDGCEKTVSQSRWELKRWWTWLCAICCVSMNCTPLC